MAFRKYIIRNRDHAAWLKDVTHEKGETVYTFGKDPAKARIYDTIAEARKMAEACRGRVQVLKMDRKHQAYAEDVKP